MDFGMLPPEVNSARIYAGPGPEPMMAAAAAWDELASDLDAAACSYAATISMLTSGPWLGRASASMAATADAYVAWMSTAAAQAQQTATQAKAAAAAYEAAFAATVPPADIAANRALLRAQVTTNFLGLNSAAIAATESHYAEMWAQDAVAMYNYAGMSAAATTLTPFTPPPQSATLTGTGAQVAALTGTGAQATAAASASGILPALQNLGLVSPSTAIEPASLGLGLSELSTASGAWASASDGDGQILTLAHDIHSDLGAFSGQMVGMEHRVLSHLKGLAAVTPADAPSVGRAVSVGALSVPPAWAAAAPTFRLAAATLPPTSVGIARATLSADPASVIGEMSLAGTAGRLFGGGVSPVGRARTPTAAAVHPAGPSASSRARTLGITAEVYELADLLRELGTLRDRGILNDEEFSAQKQRLLDLRSSGPQDCREDRSFGG